MNAANDRMTTTAITSGALSFGVTPEAAKRALEGKGVPRKTAEAAFLPSDARARIPEFVDGSFVPGALKELVGYLRDRGLALAGRLTDGTKNSRVVDVPTGRSVPAKEVDRRLTVPGLRRMFGPTPTAPESASRRKAREIFRKAQSVLVPGGFADFDDLAWSCKMVTGTDVTARGRTLYLGPKVATATGDPLRDRMEVDRLKRSGVVPILPVRAKSDEARMDLVPGMPILDRARSVTGGSVHWSLSHTVMASRSDGASFQERYVAMAEAKKARGVDSVVAVAAHELAATSSRKTAPEAVRPTTVPDTEIPIVVGERPEAKARSAATLAKSTNQIEITVEAPPESWADDVWDELVDDGPADAVPAAAPERIEPFPAPRADESMVHAGAFARTQAPDDRPSGEVRPPAPRPARADGFARPVVTRSAGTGADTPPARAVDARRDGTPRDEAGEERRPIRVAVGSRTAEAGRRMAKRRSVEARRRAAAATRAEAIDTPATPARASRPDEAPAPRPASDVPRGGPGKPGRPAGIAAAPHRRRPADAGPRMDGGAAKPKIHIQGASLDDAASFVLRRGDKTKPLSGTTLPKGTFTVRDSNGVRLGTLTSDGAGGRRVADAAGRTVVQRSRTEERYLERVRQMQRRLVSRLAARMDGGRSRRRKKNRAPALEMSPF